MGIRDRSTTLTAGTSILLMHDVYERMSTCASLDIESRIAEDCFYRKIMSPYCGTYINLYLQTCNLLDIFNKNNSIFLSIKGRRNYYKKSLNNYNFKIIYNMRFSFNL